LAEDAYEDDVLFRSENGMISNNHHPADGTGAVVIGGDYQGLGIVRSLGRRGVPVCVLDDERSIARYSRYTATAQLVPSLLAANDTVTALLNLGRTRRLRRWVLYPTRDEQVAALSQNREELSEIFRVPTPVWETVKWLWDKRNTYRLADGLDISTPRTWYLRSAQDLSQIDGHYPVALKPAIKEHFIYATKDKAWRTDNRAITRTI
jgi:D-aspartate ligase